MKFFAPSNGQQGLYFVLYYLDTGMLRIGNVPAIERLAGNVDWFGCGIFWYIYIGAGPTLCGATGSTCDNENKKKQLKTISQRNKKKKVRSNQIIPHSDLIVT